MLKWEVYLILICHSVLWQSWYSAMSFEFPQIPEYSAVRFEIEPKAEAWTSVLRKLSLFSELKEIKRITSSESSIVVLLFDSPVSLQRLCGLGTLSNLGVSRDASPYCDRTIVALQTSVPDTNPLQKLRLRRLASSSQEPTAKASLTSSGLQSVTEEMPSHQSRLIASEEKTAMDSLRKLSSGVLNRVAETAKPLKPKMSAHPTQVTSIEQSSARSGVLADTGDRSIQGTSKKQKLRRTDTEPLEAVPETQTESESEASELEDMT